MELIPPNSVEAEHDILGSILVEPDLMDDLSNLIEASYFYDPKHRLIYQVCCDLYNKNDKIDIITIGHNLGQADKDKIGGSAYLVELMQGVATTANAIQHARIIKELWQRRILIEKFTGLINDSYANEDSQTIIEKADKVLMKLSGGATDDIIPINQIATEYLLELLDNKKPKDNYLTTRIEDLNRKIIGIFKGDLTIIAGPPSMGKSSLALDLALINSIKDRKTIYFALDETSHAMAQRLITGGVGVNRERFYSRNFAEREIDMMTQYATNLVATSGNVHICDKARQSVMSIRGYASKFKRKNGLDCIIVDYLQQLSSNGKQERRDLTVSEQCEDLKAVAKDLDIAVVCLSQLNREWTYNQIDPAKGKYGFPKLASMRDSGGIEAAANLVLFPWNVLEAMRKTGMSDYDIAFQHEKGRAPSNYERAFIVVAKNKMGETGAVECYWWPNRMQFISLTNRMELTEDEPGELPF